MFSTQPISNKRKASGFSLPAGWITHSQATYIRRGGGRRSLIADLEMVDSMTLLRLLFSTKMSRNSFPTTRNFFQCLLFVPWIHGRWCCEGTRCEPASSEKDFELYRPIAVSDLHSRISGFFDESSVLVWEFILNHQWYLWMCLGCFNTTMISFQITPVSIFSMYPNMVWSFSGQEG